ncbi:MAG TPA: Mur ligase family protein [Spirochaetales bacterium]|nr:Mur ligase family protein [Spirochaetales bacterium]HRY55923.1 Mur ligase family protein [Spirochaetia bacterium]
MARPRFKTSDEVFDYLLGFVNVEKGQKTEFKLDRMSWLCSELGEPQDAFRSIHVAGSKGKGSVSAMMASMLEAAGFRTGLYTSPHILRWKERISLAGEEMPEELILSAMAELLPLVEGRGPEDFPGGELPTYFELTTLVGFCAFRAAGCAWAVIETGLGGRLDSTNVVSPASSVITPIELEHTEYLGDTIALIAAEKAGIVKAGRPCYSCAQRAEAREAIQAACARRGSELREAPVLAPAELLGIDRSGTAASLRFAPGSPLASRFPSPLQLRTPMIGAVQAGNMSLALLAAAESEPALGPEAAAAGLAKACLPARFQVLDREPPIVLDGAHTPSSAAAALASFEALFPGPKALLFACAQDKRHAELASILAPRFGQVTVTAPGSFKKSDPAAAYASFARLAPHALLVGDTAEAIISAAGRARAAGLPLLVTGSFYLCAEALKELGS